MHVINLSVSGSPVQKNRCKLYGMHALLWQAMLNEMKVSKFFKGENKSTSLFLKTHLVAVDWMIEMETDWQAGVLLFLLIFFCAKVI